MRTTAWSVPELTVLADKQRHERLNQINDLYAHKLEYGTVARLR